MKNYVYDAKVVRVVDGDSVWLEVDLGFRMSFRDNFRLLGIDTPELNSSDAEIRVSAQAAKAHLETILPVGQKVTISTSKPGKYGRWLADIYVEGISETVNSHMVEAGYAKIYGS